MDPRAALVGPAGAGYPCSPVRDTGDVTARHLASALRVLFRRLRHSERDNRSLDGYNRQELFFDHAHHRDAGHTRRHRGVLMARPDTFDAPAHNRDMGDSARHNPHSERDTGAQGRTFVAFRSLGRAFDHIRRTPAGLADSKPLCLCVPAGHICDTLRNHYRVHVLPAKAPDERSKSEVGRGRMLRQKKGGYSKAVTPCCVLGRDFVYCFCTFKKKSDTANPHWPDEIEFL